MKFKTLLISLLFAVQASANPPQWVNYLSDVEKREIAEQLAVIEANRILQTEGLIERETGPQTLSIPVTFAPINPAAEGESQAAAGSAARSSGTSGGNINCSLNVQNPHAGSGPGGSLRVKAKTSGSCSYQHVIGTPPPTINWELVRVLVQFGVPPYGAASTSASHARNGLSVSWSASSAQVFPTHAPTATICTSISCT